MALANKRDGKRELRGLIVRLNGPGSFNESEELYASLCVREENERCDQLPRGFPSCS